MTYLGPLGSLQRIRPLVDVDTTSSRLGGIHQAISGRRTVDYLGNRATYEMQFGRTDTDGHAFLEALHHRLVPGPLRLVLDGTRRNRLSRSAAAAGYGGRDLSGCTATGGDLLPSSLWPAEVTPPGAGLQWSNAEAGHELRLDYAAPAPVLAAETVTLSLHLHATAADEVTLALAHYTDGAYTTTALAPAVTLTAGAWHELTLVDTPGSWAVSPVLQVTTKPDVGSVLTLGPTQLEAGESVTAWQQGGGAPVVAVDELPTTSPYVPYTVAELTLVEL